MNAAPATGIQLLDLNENSVILGRVGGLTVGGNARWPGNVAYDKMIQASLQAYIAAKNPREKAQVKEPIYQTILGKKGNFYTKNKEDGLFYPVEKSFAMQKMQDKFNETKKKVTKS